MPNYRRLWIPGGSYFFTVALAERGSSLLVDQVDKLRRSFQRVRRQRPFAMSGVVILPDHLHCIWTLPAGDSDYAVRWAGIKAAFSAELSFDDSLRESLRRKRERGVWQRRYWEHALRNESDHTAHVDYIHYNPVKHRCVERVTDWPHSSFHRYVRSGDLPADWGGRLSPGRINAREPGSGEPLPLV